MCKLKMKKNCENCRHGYWESDGDYGEYSYFICEKREDDGLNNLDDNLCKESYRQKAKVCCELKLQVKCTKCGAEELSNTEVKENYLCFACWVEKEHGVDEKDLIIGI